MSDSKQCSNRLELDLISLLQNGQANFKVKTTVHNFQLTVETMIEGQS